MKRNLILLVLLVTSKTFAQQEWKLKKSVDDIKIYTRSTAGSELKEYKAITEVDADLETVLHELLTAPKYNDMCESGVSYYLKSEGADKHLFYAQKSLPWPVRDRDVITRLTVNRISENKVMLFLEGAPAPHRRRRGDLRPGRR